MRKTIIAINLGNYGSTGTIAKNVLKKAEKFGFETFFAYAGNEKNRKIQKNEYLICPLFFKLLFEKLAYYTGLNGLFSLLCTWKLIKQLRRKNVSLLHLHNLHNSYVNLPLLFYYIKKVKIPIVWTLHDCWAFTGRCPHFILSKCDKWKKCCHHCHYPKRSYPQSCLDTSRMMWNLKRHWFTGMESCTIVTPSQWLANLVKQSFLKDYPVKVINNGIDLSVFKPAESDFRIKNNLQNKKIVLGVAFDWGERKGLDVFIELAHRLPDNYCIILVGTDESIDRQLPSNIISIHRTQNQIELAEIYTAADVFANPTREEVLGLVNIESLACGTPVVTFRTGGCPECIDESCGSVVDCDDIDSMEREIKRICETRPFTKESCITYSKKFDKNARFDEYVELYKSLVDDK